MSIQRYGLRSRHIYVDGKASSYSTLSSAASEELAKYKQEAEPTLTVRAFDRKDMGEKVDKLGYLLRTHILSKPTALICGWYAPRCAFLWTPRTTRTLPLG